MAPCLTGMMSILFLSYQVTGSENQGSVDNFMRKIFKGMNVCLDDDELMALTDLKKGSCLPEKKVYFSVYLTSHLAASSLTRNQPIKYTDVVTNEGNGYNRNTGEFTAPRSGGYIFFWEFLVFPNGNFWIVLQLNGKLFVKSLGYGATSSYEMSSKSTIVNLRKGDIVRLVFHNGNGKIWGGDRYTCFSGYSPR